MALPISLIKERIRCDLDDEKNGQIEMKLLVSLMLRLGVMQPETELLLAAFAKEHASDVKVPYEEFLDWLFEVSPEKEAADDVPSGPTNLCAREDHTKLAVENYSLRPAPLSTSPASRSLSPLGKVKSPKSPRKSPLSSASSTSSSPSRSPCASPVKANPPPHLLLPIQGRSFVAGRKSLPGIAESGAERATAWTNVQRSDFKSIGYLGDGGFGQVRLVVYRKDGERYALKSIEHALMKEMCLLSGDKDSADSPFVERDVGIAAREWRSPFIVQLYATFQTPDKLHFVYELCPGGDLFDLLAKQDYQRFTESDARFYLAEMTLGLTHLHDNGIVHGDIKLENVLIAKDCHVKLTDLGSAFHALRNAATRKVVHATHSPPEVRNGSGEFGKELDCWQLGYAAVTMLSGEDLSLELEDYQSIVQETLSEVGVSQSAVDYCERLLTSSRRERLGFPDGAVVLQTHSFNADMNWQAIEEKSVEPPVIFAEFPMYGRGRFHSSNNSPRTSENTRVRGFSWAVGPDAEDSEWPLGTFGTFETLHATETNSSDPDAPTWTESSWSRQTSGAYFNVWSRQTSPGSPESPCRIPPGNVTA
jgi:serine/threonine protein kinase